MGQGQGPEQKPEPRPVAHGLDVAVLVGVQDARDRHALGEALLRSPGARTPMSASLLVRTKSPSRSERPGRAAGSSLSFRSSRGTVPRTPPEKTTLSAVNRVLSPVEGSPRVSTAIARVSRTDGEGLGLGEHLNPALLGEVEVVPVEGVLRAHPAAGHAGAALRAADPVGAPRRRSRDRRPSTPGFPKKTATSGGVEVLGSTDVLGPPRGAPRRPSWSRGFSAAPSIRQGRGVVRVELGLPVGQVAPGVGLEEERESAVGRVFA